jgi:hypothetical protein
MKKQKKKKNEIMSRCPLGLKEYPTTPCPMAIQRIKAIKYNIIIDEKNMPGCPWWILDSSSCYCFWYYINVFQKDKEANVSEIAASLMLSNEEVEEIISDNINKLKEDEVFD